MAENVKIFTPADVQSASGVTLVDFWATWCGPCRMLAPVVEEIAGEYAGRVTFGKIDIDQHTDFAIGLGIASIPTLIIFKDGAEVARMIGVQPKSVITQALDKAL